MTRKPTQSDPCERVADLDLGRDKDCIQILLRDKHGRLEGLCAEILFEKELIAPAFAEYSTGWWVARGDGKYRVAHVTESGHPVSPIEDDIYRLFLRHGVSLVRLEFDATERILRRHALSVGPAGSVVQRNAAQVQPTTRSPPQVPYAAERDAERSDKAIKYLKTMGALRSSAISRLIANCFVHSRALWDIDAVVRYRNTLISFETKQKYPSRKGKFGINEGLTGMFSFLERCDLRVIHIILTKPVWDTSVSAVDLVTLPVYAGKSVWIATESHNIGRTGSKTDAPSRTSIDGRTQLRTDDLEVSDFHYLGIQGKLKKSAMVEYLEGKTHRLHAIDEIPRIASSSKVR